MRFRSTSFFERFADEVGRPSISIRADWSGT
jgi:hypothetical protein